jgi:hypothetical protein
MDASGSAKFQLSHTPDNLARFDARRESYIGQGPAAIPYLLEWGKLTMPRSLWYEIDGTAPTLNPSPLTGLTLYAEETLEELGFVVRSN